MNTYDIVKYWDDYLVEQHVGSELAVIIDYLKKQNKTNKYSSKRFHDSNIRQKQCK